MDETGTPLGRGAFRRFRRKSRPNYRQRLASKTTPACDVRESGASSPDVLFESVEQVRLLAARAEVERTAFQSVAVAALRALDRACHHERRAAETVISLAQRQKLQHLIDEVEAARAALGEMLSPHGASMRRRNTPAPTDRPPESLWWFALCEALHALGEGVSAMQSLAAGQSPGSAARALSGIVGRLLEQHYHALFADAEHWLG